MTITIIIVSFLLFMIMLFCIVYDKSGRDADILAEQFNADFIHTKQIMQACTRKDAAKLIDAFYDRWHGLIAEWVLVAHTRNLQTYLDFEHPHIYQFTKN